MSLVDSVRKVIVPIHKEGYVFIAIGLVSTIILANLWSPFGWIGAIITIWICYFFRDPVRVTPQRGRAGDLAGRRPHQPDRAVAAAAGA